ncbi:MAG: hypothetical protein ACYDA3_05400 [Gaiellaceae bacterium]
MVHAPRRAVVEGGRLCAAACLIAFLCASAPAASTAKPKPHKPHKTGKKTTLAITPGTYSGTVQMTGLHANVTSALSGTTAETLTGTWTLDVDKTDHATGSESLQVTVPFVADDPKCSYAPPSYVFAFNASLGKDILVYGGHPGAVQRGNLVIALSNTVPGGLSSSPDNYTVTCHGDSFSWPTLLLYGFGPQSSPVEENVRFPVTFFKKLGDTFVLQISTVENAVFTQTYTLTSAPRQ